jgi:hypothetical protein
MHQNQGVHAGKSLAGTTVSHAARPLDQPLRRYVDDGAGIPRRQLQALNKTQATSILKVCDFQTLIQ